MEERLASRETLTVRRNASITPPRLGRGYTTAFVLLSLLAFAALDVLALNYRMSSAAVNVDVYRQFSSAQLRGVPATTFAVRSILDQHLGLAQHDYKTLYAQDVAKLFAKSAKVKQVAECGILSGGGLKLLTEMFPESQVYGFDVDLSSYKNALPAKLESGSFPVDRVKVFQMDQNIDNSALIAKTGAEFSFVVDDGCHDEHCIKYTYNAFLPHMDEKFLYMIEDGKAAHMHDWFKKVTGEGVTVEQKEMLTVVSRL